jgi:hypothetical protein
MAMTRKDPIRPVALMLALLFLVPLMAANTSGVFRGVLVESPKGEQASGFVFLRARNGSMRKVETSKAQVAYDESVPKEQQMAAASDALKPGADVRITAEQASDGEWHASRIDIMSLDATRQMYMDNGNDDQDDQDLYQLQLNGSNRPILRKGL